MEKTEYFVYCGFFMTHLRGERFVPSPKGEFLEMPKIKIGCGIKKDATAVFL